MNTNDDLHLSIYVHLRGTRSNQAIIIICTWGLCVKMSFNETKTRMMIICRKKKHPDLNIRMNR